MSTIKVVRIEAEGGRLELAGVLAVLFHLIPLALLWQNRPARESETVQLRGVLLIEPEAEMEEARPIVTAKKENETVNRPVPTAVHHAPPIQMAKVTGSPPRIAERALAPKIETNVSIQTEARLIDRAGEQKNRPAPPPISLAGNAGAISLQAPREVLRAPEAPGSLLPDQKFRKAEPADVSSKAGKSEISGPLSSRKVLYSPLPEYPQWAKERGVEAEIDIRFYVSAAGDVKEGAVVVRTSGHFELDRLALQALSGWKFSRSSQNGDQWGIITFRFMPEK